MFGGGGRGGGGWKGGGGGGSLKPGARRVRGAGGGDDEERPEPVGLIGAEQTRVWEDEARDLRMSVDGVDFGVVRAVRAFPISKKCGYIAFLDVESKEAALLRDPENLDEDSREALGKALTRMYYVAEILRVDEITEVMGVGKWRVLTDRGHAVFEVINREDIRELPGGRYVIPDADGNRFEIQDVSTLDPRSQSIVLSET